MIYEKIIKTVAKGKMFSLLVDPDKHDAASLEKIGKAAGHLQKDRMAAVDFILVGGSFVSGSVDETITLLRKATDLPIILFPGNVLQISDKADGILMLSLISGRNAEFLIGQHVIAAPLLKKTNLEIIPTGYILIENGRSTSVEYISNTRPIPADKVDLSVATAMAGEMLGQKLIYLEAGSGALEPVNKILISEVKENTGIPLFVGGGIQSITQIEQAYESGADVIVVGSAVENDLDKLPLLLEQVSHLKRSFSDQSAFPR